MIALTSSIAAIVAAFVGVGVFLDRYTKPAVKSQAWQQISSTSGRQLSASAVNFVVLSYESIFTGVIGSRRFFVRSLIAYAAILGASMLFLAFVFPSVSVMVLSPYLAGTWWEAVSAGTLTFVGALLFWAANAQTLYFLRLAQSDPRPTPIALIFYADMLLTASIAVVGLGFLFWLLSLAHLAAGPKDVRIQVQVVPASVALENRLASVRSKHADFQATIIADELARSRANLKRVASLVTRNFPSQNAETFERRDFEMVLTLYPQSGVPINKLDDDSIQYLGDEGEITSFKSIDYDLGKNWVRRFEDEISTSKLCEQILNPALRKGQHYVRFRDFRVEKHFNKQACEGGKVGTISATVDINSSNLDLANLLYLNINLSFQNLVSSITSGFSTFAAVHPLYYLNPDEDNAAWHHRHMISEDDEAGRVALDRDFLISLLVENGIKASVLNKTFPGGLLLTAIMLTSSFTVLLLISAIVAGFLASAARGVTVLGSMFEVKDHPFVFVMLVGGILSSIGYAVFL